MTHEELTAALVEAPNLADLPPAARGHVASCPECAALHRALVAVQRDEAALFEPPPAQYWAAFGGRLAERLRGAATETAAPTRTATRTWLPVAAALALLVAAALLLHPGTPGDAPPSAAGGAGAALARIAGAHPEAATAEADLLASPWGEDPGGWALEESPFAPAPPAWIAGGDPLLSLEAELAVELDDAGARELARRLREEMSS